MQQFTDSVDASAPADKLLGNSPFERRFASSQAGWLGIVLVGAGLLAIVETRSWLIAGAAAAFAALPAAVGLASIPSVKKEWVASLVCAVWLAFAAAVVAVTGGIGSPLIVLLLVPVALALLLDRYELARDAAIMAGLTLLACFIAGRIGLIGVSNGGESALARAIGALACLAYVVWLLVMSRGGVIGLPPIPKPVSAPETMTPRYLAELSHELKTPLNAIIGFADAMRQNIFGKLPEKYGEYVETIHSSGQHMLELVTNMLDASRIRAGGYSLNLEVIDARVVVAETVQMMRDAARAAGVSISAPGTLDALRVRADKTALKQMLTNLIANGLKYTPTGGTVTVRAEANDALVLTVSDTGVGIPQDALERVMRPFEQGPSAKVGAGLGLAVVRGLAQLHGGNVEIKSPPGSGAVITVTLPVLVKTGS